MKATRLVIAGLSAQVVGVATQGLWHALLANSDSRLLTEDRTFLIDHTISNLGVAAMVVGARQLHRQRPSAASRAVLTGTALEVVGAVGDMLSHFWGGESPVAFALIGAGFVTAVAGLFVDIKKARQARSVLAREG
ncbi:MAG: hypothetical protein GEU96_08915 [Propionibacteriales bacterium]|nr:hypothetical protein [Propionibacteriales bacterium]